MSAPVRVPVELKRGDSRWFRLAVAVAPDVVELSSAVPDELDGPLELRFHLPGDPLPVTCRGRAVEVRVGEGDHERAERRALELLAVDDATRTRITTYVQERLGPYA